MEELTSLKRCTLYISVTTEVLPGFVGGPCKEDYPYCKDQELNLTHCIDKRCSCRGEINREGLGCS